MTKTYISIETLATHFWVATHSLRNAALEQSLLRSLEQVLHVQLLSVKACKKSKTAIYVTFRLFLWILTDFADCMTNALFEPYLSQ